MGVGQWSLDLVEDTPISVLDRLDVRTSGFGHIVVTPVPVDVALGDAILPIARYTGVYREQDRVSLGGLGPNMWVADSNGKGPFYAEGLSTPDGKFADWVTRLRPAQLTPGITSTIAGWFPKTYFGTNLRDPLDEVCLYFGAEWRVTPALAFDIGKRADLFRVDPVAVVVAKESEAGRDLNVQGIPGDVSAPRDVKNIVRRVNLYSGDQDAPTVTFSTPTVSDADFPYRGPDGSVLRMDQRYESWDAPVGSEAQYANNLQNLNKLPHEEIKLTTRQYDIGQNVEVGDNLWVFDPLKGIRDLSNPVDYRGVTIYPEIIRCVGYTWPVRQGMGVYFRRFVKVDGSWVVDWIDLTNYVEFETGDTSVEIGDKPRSTR